LSNASRLRKEIIRKAVEIIGDPEIIEKLYQELGMELLSTSGMRNYCLRLKLRKSMESGKLDRWQFAKENNISYWKTTIMMKNMLKIHPQFYPEKKNMPTDNNPPN